MRGVLVLPFILLAVVAGCSAKGASPSPESTVTGTAALSSYRSKPSTVVATNEAGLRASAPLGASGSFSLSLPKGHTYKLAMATPSGEVPLVFPRRSGALGASFTVKSNGATTAGVGSIGATTAGVASLFFVCRVVFEVGIATRPRGVRASSVPAGGARRC